MNEQKNETSSQRPLGVTILAIFSAISAALLATSIIKYVIFLPFSLKMFDIYVPTAFIILPLLTMIFFTTVLSLLAYGFWKGLKWSWFLAIAFCIVSITLELVMLSIFLITGYFASPYADNFFQIIRVMVIARFITVLIISGLIIFYLVRPKVRSYFQLGEGKDILEILRRRKGIIMGVLAIVLITVLILIWGFTPTKVEVVSITQTPSDPQPGDEVTITVEVTGGSPFLGPMPRITYQCIGRHSVSGGSLSMKFLGDNKYSWSTHVENETVIWYMIFSNDVLLADDIIQTGFNDLDETTIMISNITQFPEKPTSETEKIEIFVEIDSVYNLTEKSVPFEHVLGLWSGGSKTNLIPVGENRYKITFTPATIYGFELFGFETDKQNYKFQKGLKIYYRIIVFDEANNIGISPTQTITIY